MSHEATVELYRLLKLEKEPNIDDVKKCIDNRAKLKNIISSSGNPLICAIMHCCSPDIIQLLVDKGGIDWNYKSYYHNSIYHNFGTIFDVNFVCIHSLKNSLVYLYHTFYKTNKITNFLLDIMNKQRIIKTKGRIKNIPNKIVIKENIELLQKYCQILQYDFNSLENDMVEVLEDIQDFKLLTIYKENKLKTPYLDEQ